MAASPCLGDRLQGLNNWKQQQNRMPVPAAQLQIRRPPAGSPVEAHSHAILQAIAVRLSAADVTTDER